ncbi:MAG: hypothetical protein K2X61_06475 [Caulobacteraceae bacterium]|nr:hypothetical protein [Caulobacteraceae bacterium]
MRFAARCPEALVPFLETREDWAFGYGPEPRTHDCARFCGAGVAAVTGVDPLDAFAGRWTSERGARRVLAAHGGLASAVSTVMRPIAPTLAQRGDVGMTDDGALVLFEGQTVVGVQERGLRRLPRSLVVFAWTAD